MLTASEQKDLLNREAMRQARDRWNAVAKPLRSLGRLEELIVQLAGIQRTEQVALRPRCVAVFCGDHGVVEAGVSQSGSDVTFRVAEAIGRGQSNVNLMAKAAGADVFAFDLGMQRHAEWAEIADYRVGDGTKNMIHGPAMTPEEVRQAVQNGEAITGMLAGKGYRLIGVGEMGIGNTTSASAIASVLTGLTVPEATGRGAGLSDAGLRRKVEAIERAIAVNAPDPDDPWDALSKLGGYEIAGMVGAYLGAARQRTAMVIDGVVSAAAALIAVRIDPTARQFMLPSHVSREPAGRALMRALDLEPIVDARMALGEGTGAIMLMPLLDMALAVYAGEHTFKSLDMQPYEPQERMV